MKRFAALLGLVLLVSASAWGLSISDPSWDRSTRVTVTPQPASPADDISVTVSRWVEAGYQVASSTLESQGTVVRVDLHWVRKGGVIAVWPVPFGRQEYTVSIGKWNPGKYTVFVSNDGKDMAAASFVIAGETSGGASSGWSLTDGLLRSRADQNSSSESLIDRLRRIHSTSQFQ
jgi:hypothetical protein